MVGGTIHQQQQAPQLANPSSSSSSTAHKTTSEEDELLKRNTDCVYFLASPLTCKKGSECEYRHSDIARVNPRDCWYWLNGNCLNPKCAFRHPPLDGLLGSDVPTPMGPPVPAPHATPYAAPKQGIACIFFQKGFCLKGHLCPFSHGPPNPVNNKPAQPGPTNPVTEPPKITQHAAVQKPAESLPPQGKPPFLPTRSAVDKKTAPPASVVPPPVTNRSVHHGYHASNNERVTSGKDADEYSREPSPGFDVLVDNDLEESRHYYDADHVDRDIYREHRDFDHYNDRDGHFDVDRHPKIDHENESDLRHRLSKQRRGSDNSHADRMPRDSHHHYHHHRRQDQGSLSSRLRGRIKIPGRSVSPTKENNSRVEREIDVERRHLSRNSPGRPPRIRDRINDTKFAGPKRLSELKSVRTEDERYLGKRKHTKVEDGLSFEGPKPLSEILKRKRGINNDTNNNTNANTEDDDQKKVETKEEQEKDKTVDGNSVSYEAENEGGLVDEDALLDEELEAYDENGDGDNEYEYEQMDGEEDYNLDEGEEEYVEEEGGDAYGKKEGVVYS